MPAGHRGHRGRRDRREHTVSNYLLIESRDPFTTEAVSGHVELAVNLRRAGHSVTLYLVQNGVLPARAGADGDALHQALAADVEVLADDFSLRERGIGKRDVARGVKPASIGLVVERLAAAWKVLFL
jgi:sulfur relay (sulfurtransferase) complex TusBCD TusD component (DsrE family)